MADDNTANGTNISLVQGDTQLMPAQATTVTQQFVSNDKIVGVVGPAGSQEVEAVGPLFGRAGLAFITGSATNSALTTSGKNPTFFRVVSRDDVQGPQDAHYIVNHLHPKALMIVDDQEAYSTGLVSAMLPIFKAAGIKVDHESVSQKVTDFSSLVAKVTLDTSVVVLPWQVAANGQQFGKNLAEQQKKAVIFGTDGLFSPSSFTTNGAVRVVVRPGHQLHPGRQGDRRRRPRRSSRSTGRSDRRSTRPRTCMDEAIASACKNGSPSRSSVLAAVKATDEPTSILGQPIKFDSQGRSRGREVLPVQDQLGRQVPAHSEQLI